MSAIVGPSSLRQMGEMSQTASTIQIDGAARTYHRRLHPKADGRALYSYGYAPHTGDPSEEFTDPVAVGSLLRRHPLLDSWAIYSPHRQNRTFKPSTADDPLAPATPGSAITEIPFPDFELAIFGNRFTSLHPASPEPEGLLCEEARASGACEVIVYSPEASGSMATLSQERRVLYLEAVIDRYKAHFDAGNDYVLPFENRGDAVGVTLHHPHGQLYALPHVPQPQATAARAFADGYDLTAERARWGAGFTIHSIGPVTAFVPPYARFPYEAWITTEQRRAGPWEMTGEELEALAEMMGFMTARYDALFGAPMPYMMSLNAAPRVNDGTYHFTVQYFPLMRSPGRVKYLAGVEQTTRVFTVDVMPETAAKALRDAV